MAYIVEQNSLAEGLRDRSEKPGEDFAWLCAGLVMNSPNHREKKN